MLKSVPRRYLLELQKENKMLKVALFLLISIFSLNISAATSSNYVDFKCAQAISAVVSYLTDEVELIELKLNRSELQKSYMMTCVINPSEPGVGVILRKKGYWQPPTFIFEFKYPSLLSVRYGRASRITRSLKEWHRK
jgi:hypothetical protein